MLSDRLTARVIGLVLISVAGIIDVSCFLFVNPEVRAKPSFPLVVILPSLPIFALGVWVIRRASKIEKEGL